MPYLYFLFCEAAENFQISFQEPATTEMDGIYLFNCHLLFNICWLFIVIAVSIICCFFSFCLLLFLKYKIQIFVVFILNMAFALSSIDLLLINFCYLITNTTSLLVLKLKSSLVEILIKYV